MTVSHGEIYILLYIMQKIIMIIAFKTAVWEKRQNTQVGEVKIKWISHTPLVHLRRALGSFSMDSF